MCRMNTGIEIGSLPAELAFASRWNVVSQSLFLPSSVVCRLTSDSDGRQIQRILQDESLCCRPHSKPPASLSQAPAPRNESPSPLRLFPDHQAMFPQRFASNHNRRTRNGGTMARKLKFSFALPKLLHEGMRLAPLPKSTPKSWQHSRRTES